MTYDLDKEDKTGHRIFHNGRLMFDAECERCTAAKMSDVWRWALDIGPDEKRKTLNVEKLSYVIETIKRENV